MVTGGLRNRFVRESIFEHVNDELTVLGWFTMDPVHQPLLVVYAFPEEEDPVEVNTLSMTTGSSSVDYTEMGSLDFARYGVYFFDFFAEDDGIGMHLIGDLEDFFKRTPTLEVYDYENAKAVLNTVELTADVDVRKPTRITQPWQKFWYTLSIGIEDDNR